MTNDNGREDSDSCCCSGWTCGNWILNEFCLFAVFIHYTRWHLLWEQLLMRPFHKLSGAVLRLGEFLINICNQMIGPWFLNEVWIAIVFELTRSPLAASWACHLPILISQSLFRLGETDALRCSRIQTYSIHSWFCGESFKLSIWKGALWFLVFRQVLGQVSQVMRKSDWRWFRPICHVNLWILKKMLERTAVHEAELVNLCIPFLKDGAGKIVIQDQLVEGEMRYLKVTISSGSLGRDR